MSKRTFPIKGMDCADCALKIEKGVSRLEKIESARVDFAAGLLEVRGAASLQSVRQRVEALGYRLEEDEVPEAHPGAAQSFWRFLLARSETRLALAGGALLLLGLLFRLAGFEQAWVFPLQILALALAGYPIARSGLSNLVINRDFNINLLMTIAAVGAIVIGEIAEGATLIFLYAIAEALEGFTADRARNVLGELRSLSPSHAIRLGSGGEERVPVEALRIGDRILIKPGERIPMDGEVLSGSSDVDQAAITGESLPVTKETGDDVFAGAVNGGGALEVRVSRLQKDNTLSRIVALVTEAQSVRAPAQRFIDRFARVYTPVMVAIALLVAVLPPLLFGQPFFNPAPGERGWLYRALALLVIACPCALVISAPVTILSAITAAAKRGVLIKGGVFLEALANIKVFAFDKTGTLTRGEPAVTLYRSTRCLTDDPCEHCTEVLGLAYALEQRSTHPLARAVVSEAEARGLNGIFLPADDVQTLAGRGLQGRVNGKLTTIGNHRHFEEKHPHGAELCTLATTAEQQGQTAMLVSHDDAVLGLIAVADQVRPDSRPVIAQLRSLGLKTVMLTGDNLGAANSVGRGVGIDAVRAELLPEEKVAVVKKLGQTYGSVAMVGDGINDTPALAAATVGISMGGAASAQALETADVVLMADDLGQLPYAVRLSGFTRRLIRANVWISLLTKLLFAALALAGITSMWLALLADVGVSLLVTLNGTRALRFDENALPLTTRR